MNPRILAAGGLLLLTSCGYIGDPLPPLANVPGGVQDLAAIQRGDAIIAHFTIPQLTTESKPIPRPLTIDLRLGPDPSSQFEVNQWAGQARHVPTPEIASSLLTYRIPAAEFAGKEVILAVRITAGNGKQSPWSNLVVVPVIAAPPTPADVIATATARGVRVAWRSAGGHFRVIRKAEDGEYLPAAAVEAPEWIDTAAEFGKSYSYIVQTIVPLDNKREAESELSAPVSLTPVDTFPPAAPAGLRANAAPASIELAWERSPEPDLASYRVYRATGGGAFERLEEVAQVPSYSDRAVEHGKTYRYSLTAVDHTGNESVRCAPVEVVFP